jgi:hypothetical protein
MQDELPLTYWKPSGFPKAVASFIVRFDVFEQRSPLYLQCSPDPNRVHNSVENIPPARC